MASEDQSPAMTVGRLLAFSHAELVELMGVNRQSDGAVSLPVDDWDRLSEDERGRLAEKLMAAQRALGTPHPRPLDVGALDVRLRSLASGDTDRSARWRIRRSPDSYCYDLSIERETERYNELVKDGGRPLYPIALLPTVSTKSVEYQRLLRPWAEALADRGRYFARWDHRNDRGSLNQWEVFGRQLYRWELFRAWQRDNRHLGDEEGGYAAHLERRKKKLEEMLDCTRHNDHPDFCMPDWEDIKRRDIERLTMRLAEVEDDVRREWRWIDRSRRWQRHYCREGDVRGNAFADYVEAARRRLAQHGFTRPFQFHEDPKQQDERSTWIEYLYFETWWYDTIVLTIRRLRPTAYQAWRKLVDSKVLRPHETPLSLRTMKRACRDQAMIDQARAALDKAEQTVRSLRLTMSDPQRLQEATRKWELAKCQVESCKKRSDSLRNFFQSTKNFDLASKDLHCHRPLLSWILKQLDVIEAKMRPSQGAERRTSGPKRRFDTGDETAADLSCKRRKVAGSPGEDKQAMTSSVSSSISQPQSSQSTPLSSRAPEATVRQPACDASRSEPTTGHLRRSARLEARRSPFKDPPRTPTVLTEPAGSETRRS
ncbi:hypothetical protein VTK73DRAFT_8584 [Phialemonium thermophilum]|uniref:Uncharacterized protein n=1 Tax=Phialemonium thermophilum TaxID=223376 RepID=A0ABR3W7Q1_9PEZI